MKAITELKPHEEIGAMLEDFARVLVIGCGTCATMCHTGGQPEVAHMAQWLADNGKLVTECIVVPTACDEMTSVILDDLQEAVGAAQAVLVMACGFGVRQAARQFAIPVVPALDTLFFGIETELGIFEEVCRQCGECVVGQTAGICPIAACHKGLMNGPCGGVNHGKCEVDNDKDCAWTLIYERLKFIGRLDQMRAILPPKRNHRTLRPARVVIPAEGDENQ